MTIRITVRGKPAPQGSKRRGQYGQFFESSAAVKPWREAVRSETQRAIDEPLAGAVNVTITFILPRPKGHYRTGRHAHELRPAAPYWHMSAPDLDKLCRAVLDGLTEGHAWKDDAQVCSLNAQKTYATVNVAPGCLIELDEAEMP